MKRGFLFKALAFSVSTIIAYSSLPLAMPVKAADSISGKYSDEGYHLVWNDEFEGDSLNTSDWNVEQHDPGWVNSELQRYTDLDNGNILVKDGKLVIKPHVTEDTKPENNDTTTEVEKKITNINFDFTVDENKQTSETIALQINLGKIEDSEEGTAAATVELSKVSLVDIDNGDELLKNTSFDGDENWSCGITSPAEGSYKYENNKAVLIVDKSGDANWHYQLQQNGLCLESGHSYRFSVDASSTSKRMVEISLLDLENGYSWYAGEKATIEKTESVSNQSSSSNREITSGRITTQGLHDFTYGRFEARAKVPAGKGYLPAFWLMATDEGLYGQWPKCGEIDIMEVMGQDTSKSYHTIHYGYSAGSGHKENQGSKVISDNGYSDEYHIFRVDWEPGNITWYVDDEPVYSTNDWYTGQDETSQLTYPAPFDQNFYIILNLAVGGSWVGYPDDSVYEHMNDDGYFVDYVRVYQKDAKEYETKEAEAKRPAAVPVSFRDADENGNYIVNGDFSRDISFDGDSNADKDNWVLHLESDAKNSNYIIDNNSIKITPASEGAQNHSIQLKQTNIPMYKGWEYELTFDAVANKDRDIIVDVEGPDKGWMRYFADTKVPITTKKRSYTYTFTMQEKTDANSSLEFNLGNQKSTSSVTISNVKLSHKSGEEIKDTNEKTIRPDGNYIYNSGFDQGEKRLGYWKISDETAISVTNKSNSRMLKVVAPYGTSKAKPITVSQNKLAPLNAGKYELTFDGYADVQDGLTINVAGESFIPSMKDKKAHYSHAFEVENSLSRDDSSIEFVFTKAGEYYIDNVFLMENALIKNGSFNAGLSGFVPYIHDSVKANYVIDNMNGNDNAFAITIDDTVATDAGSEWYVQLNQDGIKLEKGKKYRVSFKAKSTINRLIKYSLQEFEGNWTNYSGTGAVEIGNDWKSFTHDFTMENETDAKTRFNITMGSVDGERISKKHDIFIDDIDLIELTDEPQINAPTTEPQKEPAPVAQPKNNNALDNEPKKASDSVTSTENQRSADTSTTAIGDTKTPTSSEADTMDINDTETPTTSEPNTMAENDTVDEDEQSDGANDTPNEKTGFIAAIINFFRKIIEFFKNLISF